MTKRNAIDWGAIEADYRAGTLSNRQIADRHGVSESAIRKRAKDGEWVRTEGQSAHQSAHQPLAEILPPLDRQVRSADAGEARDHVEHGREIASRMLDELDATTSHVGELVTMIEEETADDRDGKRRNAMLKAISLPSRAMTLKIIMQALAVAKEVAGVGTGGKKEEAKVKAQEAAKPGNKFAPPAPPKLAVDNTRR